ncbi:MAG: Gfo/Idh/MocA family oxidoreductase [Planctomycetes bacterium]|nr:Gfo/Idh/MocA family oxidoreductase [Planctomycetota bacterium]
MSWSLSRRRFLQASAGSLSLPLFANQLFAEEPKKSPSDRINLGFIGVGTMGGGHLGSFLNMADVQVVAVCDVVKERREFARKRVEDKYGADKKSTYKGCAEFVDFRKLLELKDLDAVVIATPDHWHTIPCVLAARAKKDIYCEKPLTHNIAEGRQLIEEINKAKVIFQTGSQQRSEFGNNFRLAVELVRNGRIGKLKTINIGIGDPNKVCDLPEQPIPAGTDWEMWLGPAPARGYNEILCPKGIHKHYPAWRAYREYAGGGVGDMGAHHFDIAQWAMDMDGSGPVEIIPPEDPKAPRGLKFIYANGVEMIHGGKIDCEFIGEKGTIEATRRTITSKTPEIVKTPIGEKEFHVYASSNHRRNWIECLRSRKAPICPVEIGHRSASVCHLGNIGYQLRRPLKWDPVKEQFTNDAEANKLTSREPREKWKI